MECFDSSLVPVLNRSFKSGCHFEVIRALLINLSGLNADSETDAEIIGASLRSFVTCIVLSRL